MRAIDIDDAVIAASRLNREAARRLIEAMRGAQKGEAFK